MFVAATSRCFMEMPLDAALQRLVDLEYTNVEVMIHENGGHIQTLSGIGRLRTHGPDLPPDPSADRGRLQHRHRGPRGPLLRPIRRLLQAVQGDQGGDRGRSGGRTGNAFQRRSRAAEGHDGHRVGRRRPHRPVDRGGQHDPEPRHGRGALRRRQGTRPDARPQPLHLRPPRRRSVRAGDEIRLPRAAARHREAATPGPRGPGRSRVRPPGQPTEQGPLRPGPVRRHHRRCPTSTSWPRCARMRLLLESLI